jgi:hypothetical protein
MANAGNSVVTGGAMTDLISRRHRRYLATGRAAVRLWLADRLGSDDFSASWKALRTGRIPERVVRLWVQEDLFADLPLEEAARAGYPQLAGDFALLDHQRRLSRRREIDAVVRAAADAALADAEDD